MLTNEIYIVLVVGSAHKSLNLTLVRTNVYDDPILSNSKWNLVRGIRTKNDKIIRH